MRREVLEALNRARAGKRTTCLVRYLDDATEKSLVVDGAGVAGEPVDTGLLEAIDGAHRRDRSTTVDTPRGRAFLQIFNPPLRLVIVGAVHIAQSLAPMASLAGYAVTVIDPRRAFATDARFPGISVVNDWPDDAMEASAGPPHRRRHPHARPQDRRPGPRGGPAHGRLLYRRPWQPPYPRGPARAPGRARLRRRHDGPHPRPCRARHRGGEPGRDRPCGHGRDDRDLAQGRLSLGRPQRCSVPEQPQRSLVPHARPSRAGCSNAISGGSRMRETPRPCGSQRCRRPMPWAPSWPTP